ncbi:MAG: phage late control D family protein [Bradymonadales bacterium]|nr:phage late control D family protein [Bradymonadales bacterium]
MSGSALDETLSNLVRGIRVDMVNDGPDYFELALFNDEESGEGTIAFPGADKFKIGNPVEIKLGYDETMVSLFKGEICSAEAVFHESDPIKYIVGGFDKLHRLTRGRKTEHWLDMKYSDVASDIASKGGLSGDAQGTSVTHKYISMNNQTYLSFLIDMARRVNYEVNVDDAKLLFKKERTSEASVATYTFGGEPPVLKRARFNVQTAGQVTKVRVFSYDQQQKKQIIGESAALTRNALGGSSEGPALVMEKFGDAEYWISAYPAYTQAEVDEVAKAIFDEMAYKFVQVEGEIEGDPNIVPGTVITLEGVTDQFSGDYYVIRAIHSYVNKPGAGGGYNTKIFCSRPSWNG